VAIGKYFKRLGRKTAKIHTKINRVATPIAAAAAGYFAGAPGAAAVTAIGAQSGYYFRATQARNEGTKGRAARELGRGERKRVAIYGAIGGGAGMLGSFGTSLIAGKGLGNSLVALGLGQSGAELTGAGSIFSKSTSGTSQFVTTANLAAQKSTGVPGLVTQAQLSQTLSGGAAEAAGAGAGGSSLGAKLLGTIPAVLNAYSTARPASSGAAGTIDPNSYGGSLSDILSGGGGGGGGGGSDSGGGGGGFMNAPMAEGESKGGLIAALVIGALLLAG